MKTGNSHHSPAWSCLICWAILTHALASASSWAVLGIQDTGLKGVFAAAISVNGEIYSSGACPAPTATVGDASQISSCVTKTETSGVVAFSIRIGGAHLQALVLDAQGSPYIAGSTGSLGAAGFATTPGAYLSRPPNAFESFVCKLSSADGHPSFCTFVDVGLLDNSNNSSVVNPGFNVDAAGNTYLAGYCVDFQHLCAEKLNSTGTANTYLTSLTPNPIPNLGQFPFVATDARGDLYVAQTNVGIIMLNASGSVIGKVANLATDLPMGLAFLEQPEVLFQDSTNLGHLHIRRYTPDLSTILFDTNFFAGDNPIIGGLAIDSVGIAYVWGSVMAANLAPYHATHSCPLPTVQRNPPGTFLGRFGDDGKELQLTYLEVPYASGPMQFDSTGASLLSLANFDDLQLLKLGPAASEVALSCIGNGGSFDNMPVAPNEIVSLFGTGIGPVQPAYARPDEQGRFPVQLGGTQVTFDGVPAPLLYASSSQVNLVTPHSLAGKTATHVCAVFNSTETNCIDMPVQSAAPGVFRSGLFLGGSTPVAAAVNQDGTINSQQNPAPAGSVISLFVTGLGTVTPSPPDGGITPNPPPEQDLKASVVFQWYGVDSFSSLQTMPVNALYAGPAPLEVEGLGQINVEVPATAPTAVFVMVSTSDGGQAFSSAFTLWTK